MVPSLAFAFAFAFAFALPLQLYLRSAPPIIAVALPMLFESPMMLANHHRRPAHSTYRGGIDNGAGPPVPLPICPVSLKL